MDAIAFAVVVVVIILLANHEAVVDIINALKGRKGDDQ